MERWRCLRCETLNPPNLTECIVCEYNKIIIYPPPVIVAKCEYQGCHNKALMNQKLCEYHYYTLCPMCKQNFKETGLDYCLDCGTLFIKRKTKPLRIINSILSILNIFLIAVFAFMFIAYYFLL